MSVILTRSLHRNFIWRRWNRKNLILCFFLPLVQKFWIKVFKCMYVAVNFRCFFVLSRPFGYKLVINIDFSDKIQVRLFILGHLFIFDLWITVVAFLGETTKQSTFIAKHPNKTTQQGFSFEVIYLDLLIESVNLNFSLLHQNLVLFSFWIDFLVDLLYNKFVFDFGLQPIYLLL